MKRKITTKEMNRNYFLKQRANMLELMRVLSTPVSASKANIDAKLYNEAGDAQLELMATNLFRLANQLIRKYVK